MITFTVAQIKDMIVGLPDDAVIQVKPVIRHVLVYKYEAYDSGTNRSGGLAYDMPQTIGKQRIDS